MQALIQIIKVNDLRSGLSKTTGKPYSMQDAECLLLADDGSPKHVGVLTLPRNMTGESAPGAGTYTGTFALQSSLRDRRIEAVLTGLTPVSLRGSAFASPSAPPSADADKSLDRMHKQAQGSAMSKAA
jgi:hypothetical protein